jgi:hypothetical protein
MTNISIYKMEGLNYFTPTLYMFIFMYQIDGNILAPLCGIYFGLEGTLLVMIPFP